ncbi:hypothetical protein HBI38_237240 [Parastagonospora nodorum]|nr:hypothetical protein HBI72_226300 [Parastagonospora nodorum]KAH5340651.1 hypothetical protein HBI48_244110 [Parastagonospora nodorum]KAH6297345.1 hypothetical protein HBI38_237240 [Parastagonospora nodorum]KAH6322049.1 hypothetical protein HBI37_237450 [Parastagonospora nodorum]KAH6336900.1 hypothetical protein HBI36_220970 [Parastagonospora nodorum]
MTLTVMAPGSSHKRSSNTMSAFLALAPHKAGHLPIIIHVLIATARLTRARARACDTHLSSLCEDTVRMEHQSNTRSLGTFERVHLVKDRDAVHGPQYASGRLSLIISLGAR